MADSHAEHNKSAWLLGLAWSWSTWWLIRCQSILFHLAVFTVYIFFFLLGSCDALVGCLPVLVFFPISPVSPQTGNTPALKKHGVMLVGVCSRTGETMTYDPGSPVWVSDSWSLKAYQTQNTAERFKIPWDRIITGKLSRQQFFIFRHIVHKTVERQCAK